MTLLYIEKIKYTWFMDFQGNFTRYFEYANISFQVNHLTQAPKAMEEPINENPIIKL